MRLKDRVAVTTGSGGPMGQAIAAKLVAEGAKVVLNDISANRMNEVLGKLREMGGEAVGVRGNATVREEAAAIVAAAIDHFGRIDILVNVVGGIHGGFDTPLLAITQEEWERTLALNLHSTLNCVQLAAPHMLAQKYGKIVNISSVVATQGSPGQAHYSSSKAGLIAFTKTAARELAPHLNVNCILPGLIETRVMGMISEDKLRKYRQAIPLGRLGRPEDVANAVAFLASDEASYITGHGLVVGGGLEYSP